MSEVNVKVDVVKSSTISVRVPAELKNKLNAIAEHEYRTLSQQALMFIDMGVNEYLKNNPSIDPSPKPDSG